MNAALIPFSASRSYADTVVREAVSVMGPGWIVLRDCMLGFDGTRHAVRVQYSFLHAQVGIALLDVVPGTTTTNAVELLTRKLDAAGFGIEFLRNPQIRYLCMPLRALSNVGQLLDREFGSQSSSTLPQGDAWVATAQRLLMAEPLRSLPQPALEGDVGDPPNRRLAPAQQHSAGDHRQVWPLSNARWLGVFWGVVAMTFSGGGLFLNYLGPPAGRAGAVSVTGPEATPSTGSAPTALHMLSKAGAFTGAVPSLTATAEAGDSARALQAGALPAGADIHGMIDADPKRGMIENDQAIAKLQRRLKRFEPEGAIGFKADEAILETPPDHALPGWAATLTGTVGDAPASTQPAAVEAPPPASDPLPMPVVQPVQKPSTGAPSLLYGYKQALTRPDDEAVLSRVFPDPPAVALADAVAPQDEPAEGVQDASDAATGAVATVPPALPTTETNPAVEQGPLPPPDSDAAVAAPQDGPAGNAQDAPEAAIGAVATVPPSLPAAGNDPAAEQGPSPPSGVDAAALPAEPASTARTPVPMEAAPLQRVEPTPLLPLPTAMLAEAMIRRADALLRRGDVSAARLLYERAASAGSGPAATAMGRTFDTTFLAGIGVTGMGGDPALAAAWYRRALELGDEEARGRLQALLPSAGRTSIESQRRP